MKVAFRIFLEDRGIAESDYLAGPLEEQVAVIAAFEKSEEGNSACLLLTWYLWVLHIYRQVNVFYSAFNPNSKLNAKFMIIATSILAWCWFVRFLDSFKLQCLMTLIISQGIHQ